MKAGARTMTLERARKLGLRVETEPHGGGAGIGACTVFRGGQWLYQGTAAEAQAFLAGYQAAVESKTVAAIITSDAARGRP